MKLTLFNNNECWIKDGTILPSNFDSMSNNKKVNYIGDNGLLHREEGPAVISSHGDKYWFLNGLCHRIDGPAVIDSCGYKEWYLNGIYVNEEVYKKIEGSTKEELLMFAVLPKYKDYLSLVEYRLSIL